MTVDDLLKTIGLGVIATLIASGLIWIFRRQLIQAFAALDMSAGAALAWGMAFIMLVVIIVFPLINIEIPPVLTGVFAVLVGCLIGGTIWRRR